jgi:hypothetical protein
MFTKYSIVSMITVYYEAIVRSKVVDVYNHLEQRSEELGLVLY